MLLVPRISACVMRSWLMRERNAVRSYRKNPTNATNNASELVTIVISISFRLIERWWKVMIVP